MRTTLMLAAFAVLTLPAAAAPLTSAAVPKTQVTSAPALAKLIANTGVTLQWNWDAPAAKLSVTADDGWLHLMGAQRDSKGGSLDLDGVVTRLDERILYFKGRIAIHDAEANVDCVRDGEYTFRIMGARKFWRMKEQEAHCEGRADLTDYVDIHFR